MEKYYVTLETGLKIKYKGVLDLTRFYKHLRDWLEEQGYAKEQTLEKKYTERIKPDGKQYEIMWEAGKKVSDYFSYNIEVDFLMWGFKDVEVIEEGIKKKLQKGSMEIRVIAYIDYGGGKWESLGPLARLYQNFIARRRLKEHYEHFYDTIYTFQEEIKKSLNLRA